MPAPVPIAAPAPAPEPPTDPSDRELERVAMVPPKPRRPRRPVGWLLAPELLSRVRSILHTHRGDPRDWMPAAPGRAHVEDGAPDAGRIRDIRIDRAGGAVTADMIESEAQPHRVLAPEAGELWFDFLADTGDGEAAMYSTAYALQSELVLEPAPADGDRRRGSVLACAGDPAGGPATLPRGQFVVFGGDTAYHVADRATVAGRVRAPFAWAARDVRAAGGSLWPRRRLYAVPGNHDWYDELGGFGDLFRRGGTPGRDAGPLDLAGFERVQAASYAAIELPWDWQLWALDVLYGLDRRQEEYLRSLPRPRKHVVVTHTPPVAFDVVRAPAPLRDALRRLDLPAYFDDGAAAPPPGTCRLDLAGDEHLYARYERAAAPPDPAGAPARYRSLVSGLGGAFHHPSFTVIGDRRPSAQYPPPDQSRRAIGRRLFNPLWLYRGGLIRVVPILYCLCVAAAALSTSGTGWAFDRLLARVGIDREAGVYGGGIVPIGDRGGAPLLADAFGFLGCLVVALGLVLLALWWGGRVSDAHDLSPERRRSLLELRGVRDFFDPKRSFWLSWLCGIVGAALPFVSPVLFDFTDAGAIWFDVLVYTLAGIALGGGALLGFAGGARQSLRRRLVLAVVGLGHGAAQLLAPFVIARVAFARWWALPAMTVVTVVGLYAGHALFTRTRRLHPVGLAALGLVALGAALAIAIVAADGVAVVPRGAVEWCVIHFLAPAVAMFFGCAQFGWYLAIAGAAGGHNNELGGAALVDRYRQFIRFRLTPDRLTAYVIGIDDVSIDPSRLRPRLIDRFDIAP